MIIENSIAVNELKPRGETKGGLILLSLFNYEDNYYVTRSIVNVYNSTITDIDIYNLKAMTTNKNEPKLAPSDSTPHAYLGSNISINKLLEISKGVSEIRKILPKNVLDNLYIEKEYDKNITDNLKFSKSSNEVDIELENSNKDSYIKAKKEFGTTYRLDYAGWLNVDGSMLELL